MAIEFIIVHINYDSIQYEIKELMSTEIEKYFPYSLLLMCIGLFMELGAIIVHIAAIRTNSRAVPATGFVLAPAVNGPGTVIVQGSTTTSNLPYAQFS